MIAEGEIDLKKCGCPAARSHAAIPALVYTCLSRLLGQHNKAELVGHPNVIFFLPEELR